MNAQTVVVLGASPKPQRFSNRALRLLREYGHRVVPVHPKVEEIEGLPTIADLSACPDPVDTLTLYVGPERSRGLIDAILALHPRRVILNPGTESMPLEQALRDAGIETLRDCTLVMLREGRF